VSFVADVSEKHAESIFGIDVRAVSKRSGYIGRPAPLIIRAHFDSEDWGSMFP
jgi:hypothetical protein